MKLLDGIKETIHELTVDNTVYSGLYFGNSKIIKEFNFSFNFNHHSDDNGYIDDVKFLLDNIISKIFEINYNIQYKNYSRANLGNFIHYDNMKVMNPFIVNEYKFIKPIGFSNIDEFIDDLEILDNGQRYQINWKLPILELDKDNIVIL